MMKQLALSTIVALIAASAAGAQSPDCPRVGPGGNGMMGPGMMVPGGMDHDAMRPGPGMMRVMMIIVDADGDGALSLQEVQDVHSRLFKAADVDGNSRLTMDELGEFMGGRGPVGTGP